MSLWDVVITLALILLFLQESVVLLTIDIWLLLIEWATPLRGLRSRGTAAGLGIASLIMFQLHGMDLVFMICPRGQLTHVSKFFYFVGLDTLKLLCLFA